MSEVLAVLRKTSLFNKPRLLEHKIKEKFKQNVMVRQLETERQTDWPEIETNTHVQRHAHNTPHAPPNTPIRTPTHKRKHTTHTEEGDLLVVKC